MSERMKLGMKLEPSLLESNKTKIMNNSSNENNSTSRGIIIIVFNSNREGIGNDSEYNNTLNEIEHNETNDNDTDNNNSSIKHIDVEFKLNELFFLNRLSDNETRNESIETPPNNNITEAEQPEINPHTTLPIEVNLTLNNNETNLHTENTSKIHVKIITVPDINESDDEDDNDNYNNENNNEDDSEIYGFLIKISTTHNKNIEGTGYPLYSFSKDKQLISTCYGPQFF